MHTDEGVWRALGIYMGVDLFLRSALAARLQNVRVWMRMFKAAQIRLQLLKTVLNSKEYVSVIELEKTNSYGHASTGANGFTLIELVVTMIIVGILAVVVAPRFSDHSTFDARSFHDQTLAALRYAQKSAIAQRRTVCIAFSAANAAPATVTLSIAPNFGDACSDGLAGPNGTNPYRITAPDGVSFSALTPNVTANSFSPLGQAGFGQTIQVGGTPHIITIEQETGYVR